MVNSTRRRAKGTGSVYPVAGGFEASISFVNDDGQRRRRRRFAGTAEEAYSRLAELRAALEVADGDPDRPPPTVREFFADWLRRSVAPDCEAATFANYRSTAENHILPHIGEQRFDRVTPATVSELFADLHAAGVEGRTRQSVYTVLKLAFEYAIAIEAVEANPLDRIKRPKHERRQIKPFTAAEVRDIIDAAGDDRFPQLAALMTLAFSTGARTGELFALRWSDWSADQLRIARAVSEVDGVLHYKKPKNRASIRTIDLTDEAVEKLLQVRSTAAGGDDFIFRGRRGAPFRRSSFSRSYWSPLLDAVGVDRRGFHHCRHTFATLALTAEPAVPVHVVARILGHASPARTLRTYAHYVDGAQMAAVRAMSAVLTPPDAVRGNLDGLRAC